MASRIRQGDTVQIIAGKEKGKKGEVVKVLPSKGRVLVRGVNMIKRHTRPTQKNPQGGIVDKEASLPISNVMIVDPSDSRPTRVRFEERDGANVRVSVRTGTLIPTVVKSAAPA
jgi:large subunit ribosomal protein L24